MPAQPRKAGISGPTAWIIETAGRGPGMLRRAEPSQHGAVAMKVYKLFERAAPFQSACAEAC